MDQLEFGSQNNSESSLWSMIIFSDGSIRREWIITDINSSGYIIYLWHFSGKPRYRQVPRDLVETITTTPASIKISELCIRYPEFVCRIMNHPLCSFLHQDLLPNFTDTVLEKLNTLVTQSENISFQRIDEIIYDVSRNTPIPTIEQKTTENKEWIPQQNKKTNEKVHKSNVVIFWRVTWLRASSLSLQKTKDIPDALVPIIQPNFPIWFGNLSTTELLPVAKIITDFVENPYSLEALLSLRGKVYDTVYRNSGPEKEDYNDWLEWPNDTPESIDLVELWIDALWSVWSIYFWKIDESKDLELSWTEIAEWVANTTLKWFDRLLDELRKNPEKINKESFRNQLDKEMNILLAIIYKEGVDTPTKVSELTRRSSDDEVNKRLPSHLLPALWYNIQGSVLDVRMREHRIFVSSVFEERTNTYHDLYSLNKDSKNLETKEQLNELRSHFIKMKKYYDIVHTGSKRWKSSKRYEARSLKDPEIRSFRSSMAQFDMIHSQLKWDNSDWILSLGI